MRYRPLGSTGLLVSELAFGAGPIAGVMTGTDGARQVAVVRRAVEAGINWFDTAATYGAGQSERNLANALRQVDAVERVHVATKVRLRPEQLDDIYGGIQASVAASLRRLDLPRVTLLQLHNSITARRGDEPTSLTPRDVLGPDGVLAAFCRLREAGLVEHFGLTAMGHSGPLHDVVATGGFATIQVPFSLANLSAAQPITAGFKEANYGQIIVACERQRMGVFAIRVFAGGALLEQGPSPYTYETKFFPLDLFRRDVRRAARLRQALDGSGLALKDAALRFVLGQPGVSSAIVGFGEPHHIDEAAAIVAAGPLPEDWQKKLVAATRDERL